MIGELANVSVGGMLRLLSSYRQTGRLKVSGQEGGGEIYLEEGRVVGTAEGSGPLTENVLKLLLLRNGSFHFKAMTSLPAKARQGAIEDVENLILESSRHCTSKEAAEYLPGDETVLQMAPLPGGRQFIRLALLREEWNVLILVNGEDSLEGIRERSGIDHDRANQILYGLQAAGLVRKMRFRIPRLTEIARRELGDMGETLVRQAFRKLNIDPARMHMRELIDILNELERNITMLLGPTRAGSVLALMWEQTKR